MKKKPALMCSCAFFIGLLGTANSVNAALPLKQGAQSEHVVDLQQRLNALGYFKVGITGYYGLITTNSVKKFQQEHDLSATGDADDVTLTKLKKAVSSNPNVVEQMARIIHSEARGETFQGQVAVGAVVLNRVQSSQFPDSISDVIFQPGQFSAILDGQYNLKPDFSAYQAARVALNGVDPTNGALFYHNPKIATSAWSLKRPAVATIGNHIFTR
jgi:N-acetylmuramoyl-L-alanine amidase